MLMYQITITLGSHFLFSFDMHVLQHQQKCSLQTYLAAAAANAVKEQLLNRIYCTYTYIMVVDGCAVTSILVATARRLNFNRFVRRDSTLFKYFDNLQGRVVHGVISKTLAIYYYFVVLRNVAS